MTREEALAIAKKKKSKINMGAEHQNAFVFWFEDGIAKDGGENPIVVMKEHGVAMNFVEYAARHLTEEIERFSVS